MKTELPQVQPVLLPVQWREAGRSEAFPVARVFCVGRNYADHAQEMGASGREPPFFFMKPAQSLFPVPAGAAIDWPYPVRSADVHHELELVLALHRGGQSLSLAEAEAAIWGYGLGLDMTRRDRQAEMKATGRSWEVGKAFEASAPIGPLVSRADFEAASPQPVAQTQLSLQVNGHVRQQGQPSQMIWGLAEVVAELSKDWTLLPGDLIFTGTPAGVGPVVRGDRLEGSFGPLPSLRLRVV